MSLTSEQVAELAQALRRGERRALARSLSLVESGSGSGAALLAMLGGAPAPSTLVIGITGAAGVGKSTLTDQLVRHYLSSVAEAESGPGARRWPRQEVAVLAVDPSSPLTGGALLGDRVRQHPWSRPEQADAVFFRSGATRGQSGGLTASLRGQIQVLQAAGWRRIVVETVGAGQAETDIREVADVTVLVLMPGAGDEVQALKAGLMEIADVFVINKADRAGADSFQKGLESTLGLDPHAVKPPILRTVATEGMGVAELAATLERVAQELCASEAGRTRQRARSAGVLRRAAERAWLARLWTPSGSHLLPELAAAVASGAMTEAEAVQRLLDAALKTPPR